MKIMIIDDEPDIRTYLMTVLLDNGYETCTVRDGENIGMFVSENRPDLIIIDIMMPQRSGISIYKELKSKSESKDIPILLMSGMSSAKEFMDIAFRKHVNDDNIPLPDGFIEKPIQIHALMELIEKLLEKR